MKIKTINFKKIFVIILLLPFLAAGCGSGNKPKQPGPITLNIWKTFEEEDRLRPLIDAYRKLNPNVEVVYTKKNIDTYQQDLLNALAAGSGPDIFSVHNDWLPRYLDKVEPAPEKIFGLKEYKDAFVDPLFSDFVFEGKIYGTAMSVDSLGLFYNKDLLGSNGIALPPKTWPELASQVRRVKRADGKGYFTRSGVALGTSSNVNRAVDILYLFMLQQGAQSFSADRRAATFADPIEENGQRKEPGQAALDFYTSFANPGSENYNWNLRSDYSIDAFANGRSAFLFSYNYTRPTLLAKNPNLNFDVASVPQPDLEKPAVNFANYWGEVVSKQSKNSQEAWRFLKFITSKESLDSYYAQNQQPSSRRDLIELQVLNPTIGVFANANLTAKTFYKPDQEKMDAIMAQAIDNVFLKGLDSAEAIQQAQSQANTLTRNYE